MNSKVKKFLCDLPFYIIMYAFIILVIGITATVIIGCFSLDWRDTFLPEDYSLSYLQEAWTTYNIGSYYVISLKIVVVATLISILCSLPTAYVLARKDFKF